MGRHVFISYSRTDRRYVAQLADFLKERGLPVWWDVSRLEAGDRFESTIREAIIDSFAVIVVKTPSSMKSTWVDAEVSYALELNKPVRPLLLMRYDGRHAPLRLHQLQDEDVTNGRMPSREFVDRLRKLGGRPPLTPPPPPPPKRESTSDLVSEPTTPPPANRTLRQIFRIGQAVAAVALLLVAVVGGYRLVRAITTWQPESSIDPQAGQFRAHLDDLAGFALSPDGKTLALTGSSAPVEPTVAVPAESVDDDGSTRLELWDVADPGTPTFLASAEIYPRVVSIDPLLTFSPDGAVLLVGGNGVAYPDPPLTVWNVSNPSAPTLAYSGGSSYDALVDWLGTTRTAVWLESGSLSIVDFADPANPVVLADPEDLGGGSTVRTVATSLDGGLLASAYGADLSIWDIASRQSPTRLQASRLPLSDGISSITFGMDRNTLLINSTNGITLWDLAADATRPPTQAIEITTDLYPWIKAVALNTGKLMLLAWGSQPFFALPEVHIWLIDGRSVSDVPTIPDNGRIVVSSTGIVASAVSENSGTGPITVTLYAPLPETSATAA